MKDEFLKNKKLIVSLWHLFLCLFIVELTACKNDNDVGIIGFDPSKEVEITDFSPKSGSARSKLFIYGNNFGTDTTKMSVYVGGYKAPIIGVDGECIYCMVPLHSEEGTIEVKLNDGEVEKSATAKNRFIYISRTVVSTLCGYTTSEGKYEIKDGTFEEAGFGAPYWLSLDPKNHNHLYLLEERLSLRLIDLENRMVTTVVTAGEANWVQPRTLAWSSTGDTLFVANDQDGETSVGVTILTRETGFRVPQTLVFYRNINHASIHPVDGNLFYSTWWAGELFRYDWNQKKGVHAGNNALEEYHVQFHPSGNYAYVFSPWTQVIQRSSYNWAEKALDPSTVFVGNWNWGYADGVGTLAQVANPYQGVFVKNEKYIAEGKEDVYDFYLADSNNHCIRIITPEGKVTTFAGRGSKGLDGNMWGFVDGEIREEARFNQPWGIEYDEYRKTFYIADKNNHRIRMIALD